MGILLNIETGACRTDKSTGTTSEATLRLLFPDRTVKCLVQFGIDLLQIKPNWQINEVLFLFLPLSASKTSGKKAARASPLAVKISTMAPPSGNIVS